MTLTEYRNGMAHFFTDEGAVLHVSAAENIAKYNDINLLTEPCCRELIDHFHQCCLMLDAGGVSLG